MRIFTNKAKTHGLWASASSHEWGLPFALDIQDKIEISPESSNAGTYKIICFFIGPIKIMYARRKPNREVVA